METRPSAPHPDAEHRRLLLIGIGIAVLLAVGVSLYLQFKREPESASTNAPKAVAVTPAEYSDFYGNITNLDESKLSVAFEVTDSNGQMSIRNYQVAISETTVLQQTMPNQDPVTITQAEFELGDLVQVFGEGNLADQTAFTATHILLVSHQEP